MVSIAMFVLLSMAAFAVDIGGLVNDRRQDVTAADAGALAALAVLAAGGTRHEAAEEAARLTWVNTSAFNGSPTLADWKTRMVACTDTGRSAEYVALGALSEGMTPCISFNATNSRVRVLLPTIERVTRFAKVIGIDSMRSSAGAEAERSTGSGQYVVFGIETTCNAQDGIVITQGGTNIPQGKVHSNNDVRIENSNIPGGVNFVNGTPPPGGVPSARVPVQPDPLLGRVTMADYRPGGAKAVLADNANPALDHYFNYTGQITNATIAANGNRPGIYYTTGTVLLTTASGLPSGVTFIIDNPNGAKSFETNGTGFNLQYYNDLAVNPEKLLVYTLGGYAEPCKMTSEAIHFNGSSGNFNGVLYAPNGPVHLNGSGSGANILGAVVAKQVLLDGTGWTLRNNGDYLARPADIHLVR